MNRLAIVIASLACLIVAPALSEGVVTDISINIDRTTFRIVPISPHKGKVTGRIVDARYEAYSTWTVNKSRRVPVYTSSSGSYDYSSGKRQRTVAYYKTEYYKATKSGNPYWKEYNPDSLKIDFPFSKKPVYVDVLSNGQFSGIVELKEGHYFERQDHMPLKNGYCWWWSEVKVRFSPISPEKEGKYIEAKDAKKVCKLWYVNVSKNRVDKLTDCFSHITLDFVEKNSRVPVKTNATVTVLQSRSFEEIKSKWEAKYDSKVVKEAEKAYHDILKKNGVWRVLKEGDIVSKEGVRSIDLWVHRGATLKIESRNREFYYLKSVLSPESPEKHYSVLLVETGDKTRQDDEGHGGEIVSED